MRKAAPTHTGEMPLEEYYSGPPNGTQPGVPSGRQQLCVSSCSRMLLFSPFINLAAGTDQEFLCPQAIDLSPSDPRSYSAVMDIESCGHSPGRGLGPSLFNPAIFYKKCDY